MEESMKNNNNNNNEILEIGKSCFSDLEDKMNNGFLTSPILLMDGFLSNYDQIINTPHLLLEFLKSPKELKKDYSDAFDKEIFDYLYMEYLVSVFFILILKNNNKNIDVIYDINNNNKKYNYILNLLLNGKKIFLPNEIIEYMTSISISYIEKEFAPRGNCYQFIYLFSAIVCNNKNIVEKIFIKLNKMHRTIDITNFAVNKILK
jgi:hypothetical protein